MQIAIGTVFLKGIVLGICAVVIDYLVVGLLFHRYQARTPQTWRPEGTANYAAATVVDFLFGIGMAYFFAFFRNSLSVNSWAVAARLGLIFWALFTLPVLLAIGIFVNWHKGVWFALILDWLVIICVVLAVASALI